MRDSYPAANYGKKEFKISETVIFGKNFTFSAHHHDATYTKVEVNIDRGTLGFITSGDDQEIVPYNISGDLCDFKNVKISAAVSHGQIVRDSEDRQKSIHAIVDIFIITTTNLLIKDNKLQSSNQLPMTVGGRIFNFTAKDLDETDNCKAGYELALNQTPNKSFMIEIPYSTRNNTLYSWKSGSLLQSYPKFKDNNFAFQDNHEMLNLKGVFYVYAEGEAAMELPNEPPHSHCSIEDPLYVPDCDIAPSVFGKTIKLEPLSAKDIEQRNY